ncbi:MAG: hypothetical protein R6V15_11120, partial [Desulfotignum sp.]
VTVWEFVEPPPPVKPYEVVINELMPDPYPPLDLPDTEYIELYNTRDFPGRPCHRPHGAQQHASKPGLPGDRSGQRRGGD